MKNKIYSVIFAIVVLMFSGCTDVMNKTNLGQLLADDIWEDPYLVQGYMDQIISDALPDGKRVTLGATEELYRRYGEMGFILNSYNINEEVGSWPYGTIRNINKFLDNVDRCPSDRLSDDLKAQYKAQMLTMRGWRYFNMVRMYGGVPLVLHELSVDEDLYLPRATTSKCIAQIIQDFDDAIATESFPMRWENENEAGCISKALTYALKGRVLLYYASPQFSKTIGAGTKSAAQRWQEAYDACKKAKDELAAAGYGLFKPDPVDFDDAVRTFYELYYTEVPENREVIGVRRYYYPNFVSSGYDDVMRPNSSGGATGQDCTLEFANSFLNADGTPFTALEIPSSNEIAVSLAQSTVPYWIGREPRFYANRAHNGCIWPLYYRNAFSEDLDGDSKMRHHWAITGLVTNPFLNIDEYSQTGSIKTRKMIEVDANYAENGNRCAMDWILCRYAEVLLNFAETAVKTGHENEAIEVLQAIRRRAGIPQGNDNYGLGNPTGDALLALILKERLLELAYEADGFRVFDLRRWRLYTEDIAGYTVKNMVRHTIRPRLKTADNSYNRQAMADLDIMSDPDSYFDMFEDHIYSLDSEPFNVAERQYFFFIAFDAHIRRNPNIEQTMGWENGTFDPYQ
jgi:hypothetical protein